MSDAGFARHAKAMLEDFLDVTGKKVEVRAALTGLHAQPAPFIAELQCRCEIG